MKKHITFGPILAALLWFTACTPWDSFHPLSLNHESLTLLVGDSAGLEVADPCAWGKLRDLKWSSTDPSVAAVHEGRVTAVGKGSANIIVTDGCRMATCPVEVKRVTVYLRGYNHISKNGVDITDSLMAGHSQNCQQILSLFADEKGTYIFYQGNDQNGYLIRDGQVLATVPNGKEAFMVRVHEALCVTVNVSDDLGNDTGSEVFTILPDGTKETVLASSTSWFYQMVATPNGELWLSEVGNLRKIEADGSPTHYAFDYSLNPIPMGMYADKEGHVWSLFHKVNETPWGHFTLSKDGVEVDLIDARDQADYATKAFLWFHGPDQYVVYPNRWNYLTVHKNDEAPYIVQVESTDAAYPMDMALASNGDWYMPVAVFGEDNCALTHLLKNGKVMASYPFPADDEDWYVQISLIEE